MNTLKQNKRKNENATIEQVCEKLKQARDSMIGDEGEFIVMGGMQAQELVGDIQKVPHGFDLVPTHFYAVVELPVGAGFAIEKTGLVAGFHVIDEKGVWS